MDSFEDCLYRYVMDPKNSEYNFRLGKAYEQQHHTAAAIGFYYRTAEFSSNDLLIYEALLRIALLFKRQGSRVLVVKGTLLRAVSHMPYRPEAYFLLARTYEENRDWQEAYAWAVMGERLCSDNAVIPKLRTDVEYPGRYGFLFERAVAAWWIGLYVESLSLMRQLWKDPDLEYDYRMAVYQNLTKLSDYWQRPMIYDESMHERLRVKFKDSEKIKENYSQCFQDIFVLTMLNGKKNGRYLEIGCGDPFYGNNTALLEKDFKWSGISIDISGEMTEKFNRERSGKVICTDARMVDYESILHLEHNYGYLQIDCDPAFTSLEVLMKIPFHKYKFAVITFEHDHYLDESETIRKKSRDYLHSLGYELVIGDVSMNRFNSFEDWWIHPDLVDMKKVSQMIAVDYPNRIEDCMFFNY